MTRATPSGAVHVDVYVRRRDHREPTQQAVLTELRTLCESGAVESFDVVEWGTHAPAAPADARTDTARSVSHRLRMFRQWADHNDVSLAPVLTECGSDHSREIQLPNVLVAVYRGGELCCVTPHRDGDALYAPDHVFDALADGSPCADYEPVPAVRTDPPESSVEPPKTTAAGSRTCAPGGRAGTRRQPLDEQPPTDTPERGSDRSFSGHAAEAPRDLDAGEPAETHGPPRRPDRRGDARRLPASDDQTHGRQNDSTERDSPADTETQDPPRS